MKHVSSLTLSFILFAFITILSSTNAAQVLDTKGKPLKLGGHYYILPVDDNGGLTLNKIGDSQCPVTILQNDDVKGLPVKFSIPGKSTGNIMIDTNLEIEFTTKPDCAESSKWLMFVDHNTQQICVGIGGPKNYHDGEITSGNFFIQKDGFGDAYRFGFCSDTTRDCDFIGMKMLNSEEGGSRLILENGVGDAYSVVFVEAASIKYGSSMVDEGNPYSVILPI